MAKQIDTKGFAEVQVKNPKQDKLTLFTDQTGVEVQGVVAEGDLSTLIHNYDLYQLQDIEVTGENKGWVPCDSVFSTMLENRHNNTLRNRITQHKSFKTWPITLGIIGIILLFVGYKIHPAAVIESQKEKQLEIAAAELDKALHGKEHNDYPEGPLNIYIGGLIQGTEKTAYYNKLMYYADSMSKLGVAEKEQLQKLCDSTNNVYGQRIKKIADSVLLDAKKTATTIKQNAEKMKKDPAKAPGYSAEIAKANAVFTVGAKLTDSLVKCDSESIHMTTAQYAYKTKWLDSAYTQVVKSILADTPSVQERVLAYDLSQKDNYYSNWPWFKWLAATVFGSIGTLIMVIMFIIIFASLPQESEERDLKNTPDNLRVMAFPGRSNKIANKGSCDVVFNMSDAMREKINSVLIRYKKLHMLVPHNGFDFSDPALKVHERLTEVDFTHAQAPLVYVVVDKMAIFYAGVDMLKDEKAATENLLVIEKPAAIVQPEPENKIAQNPDREL